MAQQNTDNKETKPYKRVKPFRFKKSKVFGKRDVICKNVQRVEDAMGVYHSRSSECYLIKKPPIVPENQLPRVCRSNADCPRGYKCFRGRCIQNITGDISDSINIDDIGPMMCNINGWVECGFIEPPDPPDEEVCSDHTDQESCINNSDPIYGDGCVWCPGLEGGSCVNLSDYESYFTDSCGLPDDVDPSNPFANELGCTDPYAINYNPNAYAQRDTFGVGCPAGEDCCVYEGTKLEFSNDNTTEIDLQPGSYILTFINNNWTNGGTGGFTTFWDVFQSLSHLKHGPYSSAGDFHVTDNNDVDALSYNQIRNSNTSCVPNSTDITACESSRWYHMTTYVPFRFITNYKYRIFKCGSSNVSPPPPPPPPGHLPTVNKPGVPT